jgi:hypothetical protein
MEVYYTAYLRAYAAAMLGISTPTEGSSIDMCYAVAIATHDARNSISGPRTLSMFAKGHEIDLRASSCA